MSMRPNFPVKQSRCVLVWQNDTAEAGVENCSSANMPMKYLRVGTITFSQFIRESIWLASAGSKQITVPHHDASDAEESRRDQDSVPVLAFAVRRPRCGRW